MCFMSDTLLRCPTESPQQVDVIIPSAEETEFLNTPPKISKFVKLDPGMPFLKPIPTPCPRQPLTYILSPSVESLCMILWICPFWTFPIKKIIESLTFCYWPLSLSIIFLRSSLLQHISALHISCMAEFSRQEFWSGQPFPSAGHRLNSRIKPGSPTLQEDSLLSEPPAKPIDILSFVYPIIR